MGVCIPGPYRTANKQGTYFSCSDESSPNLPATSALAPSIRSMGLCEWNRNFGPTNHVDVISDNTE
jgi:hypothetical protein